MARGGKRAGRAGAAYNNRSDLTAQPVRTAPGQPYGAQTREAQAQKVIPLPAASQPSASPAPLPGVPAAPPPEPGMLTAPSARPNEPVTAGLPVGAGAGPESMAAVVGGDDQVLANLYQAYKTEPTPGLLAIINQAEQARGRTA